MSSDTRTLDLVTFTVPPGWHVDERGSGDGQYVVMSQADSASYCMIVVHRSTPAAGGAASTAQGQPIIGLLMMTLNGPWYDSIPPEILANPAQGANLDQRWVRLRKA